MSLKKRLCFINDDPDKRLALPMHDLNDNGKYDCRVYANFHCYMQKMHEVELDEFSPIELTVIPEDLLSDFMLAHGYT